jgi:hypothetical protein
MVKLKLAMEPIPNTLWGKALSNFYSNSPKWKAIKAYIAFKEGSTCWICGWKGKLEAHEFFSYNLDTRTQKLEAIHHICYLCHAVIHIGRTRNMFALFPEKIEEVNKHFLRVNGLKDTSIKPYIRNWMDLEAKRNSIKDWKQDFGEYNPEFIDKVWELAK